jgi:hypothetical protein
VHNAEQALKIACEKTHARITDYTVAPRFVGEHTGLHEWLIEFERAPENVAYFTDVLDSTLKQLNSDYEAKRYNNYVLSMPDVRPVPPGSFYKWLKANNKLGGQYKVPRLSHERHVIEEIMSLS